MARSIGDEDLRNLMEEYHPRRNWYRDTGRFCSRVCAKKRATQIELVLSKEPDGMLDGLRSAEIFLSDADEVMRNLVRTHGQCTLDRERNDLFHALSEMVIGQQLSAKAAKTISGRVADLAGNPFRPEKLAALSFESLRLAGISSKKVQCLKQIAEKVLSAELQLDEFGGKCDEDVVRTLTRISGIGRWTAEMFLIFGLKRLDVFSETDAGLRRAIRMLYSRTDEDPETAGISGKWRPYRSVASWYLWRSLDSLGAMSRSRKAGDVQRKKERLVQ